MRVFTNTLDIFDYSICNVYSEFPIGALKYNYSKLDCSGWGSSKVTRVLWI